MARSTRLPRNGSTRISRAGVARDSRVGSSTSRSRAGLAQSTSQAGSGRSATEQWTDELDRLGAAFRHVFRCLSRLRGRDTHLGGAEISHAQFELLIELYQRGELPAGELAAAARLTPATVTQMLEHLASCGHVERVRSDADRRVVVSRLTPKGKRQIEAKRAAWQERWTQALAGIGPSELRAATRVLERLSGAFDDAPSTGDCSVPPEQEPARRSRNPLL